MIVSEPNIEITYILGSGPLITEIAVYDQVPDCDYQPDNFRVSMLTDMDLDEIEFNLNNPYF
jgi:hypothetical protein